MRPILLKVAIFWLSHNTMRCIVLMKREGRGQRVDSQLKRGLLEYCVLAFLMSGDSYGYEIVKTLSPLITISESTLYPILKRLEKQELVTTYKKEFSGRLRKYYRITDKGKISLRAFNKGREQVEHVYEFIGRSLENE